VRRIGVVLVGVALLIAACGSSTTSTAATLPPAGSGTPTGAGTTIAPSGGGTTTTLAPADAAAKLCTLLSPADLKTTTGSDYGVGVADSYGLCTWRVGASSVNNGDGQVIATFNDSQLSLVKSSFSGGVDVTVSGHAGYWNPTQGLQSMWVDLGGRLLVLSFDPVGPETQAIAQKLAEIAIGKI